MENGSTTTVHFFSIQPKTSELRLFKAGFEYVVHSQWKGDILNTKSALFIICIVTAKTVYWDNYSTIFCIIMQTFLIPIIAIRTQTAAVAPQIICKRTFRSTIHSSSSLFHIIPIHPLRLSFLPFSTSLLHLSVSPLSFSLHISLCLHHHLYLSLSVFIMWNITLSIPFKYFSP